MSEPNDFDCNNIAHLEERIIALRAHAAGQPLQFLGGKMEWVSRTGGMEPEKAKQWEARPLWGWMRYRPEPAPSQPSPSESANPTAVTA